MVRGLSEKFTDKTSPIKNHTDTLAVLGADSKPLRHMNAVTSDVIKVWVVKCAVSDGNISIDHIRNLYHNTDIVEHL